MGCKRDSDGRQKKFLSRKISEEEIKEYLAKKAAKKLKTQSVFVWRKKIEKDVVEHGTSLDELFSVKAERRRHRERMAEAEKLNKRKEERAVEKARHDENMALLARERALSEFQDLEKKEKEFLFNQSKMKSKMRIRQGRAKPIDFLLVYNKHLELSEVFEGLPLKDMEELSNDIQTYLDWDRAHVEYWEALSVLCDWELAKASKRQEIRGLHAGVEADVRKLLDGKTHTELVKLQLDIESQLRSGSAKVVEYWEAVLIRVNIYKAKAFLKEIHDEMLRRQLSEAEEINGMNLSDPEEAFSPELMHGDDDDCEDQAIDPHEENNLLEVNLDPHEYRPRKPKYFNRVHTSYKWNKYNQTHYDHDNPPPKSVQGYKFNIFYPDLVTAPTCTILKDAAASTETCIIRFQAGPPYQDIAFRIVNKEWDYSHKKGYKCTFDGGVLHLHFNFKRHSYRR